MLGRLHFGFVLVALWTFLAGDGWCQQSPASEPGANTVDESDAAVRRGDTASTADAPSVVPPQPLSDLSIGYPDGAQGDSDVLLELQIQADGKVGHARALTGREPFLSLAEATASTWSFSPALVNDEPFSATIRVVVEFREPAPSTATNALVDKDPATGDESEPSAPQVPVVEVEVEGERAHAPHRLTRAEVRQMPGAFGDPFRAIEALPGVTPIASGLPYFFVRGAPPGNVGYFFDGIALPALYHVAAGPGVIHPAFISDVNLYAGAYPAQYGRFNGGIVTATGAPPQRERRGEASIRLVDSGAFAELPFGDGRGNLILAGRYGPTWGAEPATERLRSRQRGGSKHWSHRWL